MQLSAFEPPFSTSSGSPGRALPIAIAVALVCGATPAQTITEIIDATGDGVHAFGGPDIGAITVDVVGQVHVTGTGSDNAFSISADGAITQIIDGTGDGQGNVLDFAEGIVVDGAGNVYVAGRNSDNAFRIEPDGAVAEIIDGGGDGASRLDAAEAIAVDGEGNVYLAGFDSDNVFKIDPNGAITEIIDATGDGLGKVLDYPEGLAVDGADNVYVTGRDSHNVFKIEPGGSITQIIDATGDGVNVLSLPVGIAVDGAGNVYVAGLGSSNVFKIEPGGTITEIIDVTGDGGNALGGPIGIAVDGANNVYVPGVNSDNAFKIEPGGTIIEIVDATGDGQGNTLGAPASIAVDPCGNVYVPGFSTDNAFRVEPGDEFYFRPGHRLVGTVDAADTDDFTFYATKGTKLTITARPKGKGNTLTPAFSVLEPGGTELASSTAKGKGASVKKVEVTTTGLHCVSLSGANGSTGDYVVKTRAKYPARLKEIVEVGSDGGFVVFDGIPGTTIKRLRVKALAPKGDFATVEGETSDLRPEVTSLAACGAPVNLGTLKTSKSGKATGGKNVSELTHAGPHRLSIDGGESVGFAKVVAKLKVEKGKGDVQEK